MKPLAYIIIKYDDWHYKHKQKAILKWSDEYVIKKYTKSFIKELINSRYKEEYFNIADSSTYDDGYPNILCAMRHEYKLKLDDWIFYTKQENKVDRVEQLTDLFVKELKKYPEINCTYFDVRDKNKYCDVPLNYKKTLKIELKEGEYEY